MRYLSLPFSHSHILRENLFLRDTDITGGIYKISEQMTRFDILISNI